MYLQGDLQTMFDVLYHMGMIDPVLKMDWSKAMDEMFSDYNEFSDVVNVANAYQHDFELLKFELEKFDSKTLGYLAIEVAKEFADFHSRDDLH